MLSGFDLNSKRFKNHLKMNLEKEKEIIFPPPPFLIFGLLAQLLPLARSPPFLPVLLFSSFGWPNSSRATVAALLTLSVAVRLGPLVGAVAHLPHCARSRWNRRPHPPRVVGAPPPCPGLYKGGLDPVIAPPAVVLS